MEYHLIPVGSLLQKNKLKKERKGKKRELAKMCRNCNPLTFDGMQNGIPLWIQYGVS